MASLLVEQNQEQMEPLQRGDNRLQIIKKCGKVVVIFIITTAFSIVVEAFFKFQIKS